MKKGKKIAIIFAIVLLIGVISFAAVYYFTDIFKTPQQAFYQYLDKAADIDKNNSYQEMLEALKNAQTKSYKSDETIGIELKLNDDLDEEEQAMCNLLNNISLNVKKEANPAKDMSTSNVSLKFGGASISNLELVHDEDIYGIKSDLLGDKYLAVENNNLKDLIKKFGGSASDIPDKITGIDIYDLLYISKEDQQELEKTYNNLLKNNISEENYTKTENVNQKINGVDINTTAYTLSLSEEDFINLMIKFTETVKEDDTLLNLIVEKVNKLKDSSMFNEMSVSSSYSLSGTTRSSKIQSKLSKEDLKDTLEEIMEEFEEELDYVSESTAEIVIYTANNDVVKIEFKADDEVQSAIEYFNKDNKKHMVLYSMDKSYSSYRSTRKSSELNKVLEIEYNTTENEDSKTSVVGFTVYDDDEQIGKISFDITTKGKVGEGTNELNMKMTIEAEDVSLALKVDSKIEYTDDVDVKEINTRNANILNDMTQGEIEEYFQEIVDEFENTLKMFGLNDTVDMPNSDLTDIQDVWAYEYNDVEQRAHKDAEELNNAVQKEKEELERLEKQMEEIENSVL